MIITIWNNLHARIWLIVTFALVVILTVVSILAVAVTDFSKLLDMVLGGGPRAIYAEGIEAFYFSDYETKAEVYSAARDFNQELCEDGMVLLKNDNALPIKTPVSDKNVTAKPKISVFSKNSVNLAYGGSGSGGANTSNVVDLYKALGTAGYDYNPTLKSFYDSTSASGPLRKANSKDLDSGDTVVLSTAETPQSSYTEAVKNSYANYNDAALIVITRIGGEGFDIPRMMNGATGYRNESDHFLQLDANEEDMIAAVCSAGFKKVILAVNSGTALELGFLESDSPYVTQKGYRIDPSKIGGAVWMGFPGETGTNALANILNGSVNPSGHTPDIYASDFKADPTWNNFGDNRITANAGKGISGGDQYVLDGTAQEYYFVDYEESIYVGYKYYETRGVTDGEAWYDNAVIYPFGYGLSYTTFEWEIADKSEIENIAVTGTGEYTVKVKVTNTGDVPGKDVVQLYGHAPYERGEIEKPEVTLIDFAKTKLLEPGASETLTLTFDPYLLASYDYRDANINGHKGYELDASDDYKLYISRDSHDKAFTVPFKVNSDIKYDKDPVTGNPVVNRYTDCLDKNFDSDTQLSSLLTRSDWDGSWPTTPTADERSVSAGFIAALKDVSHNNPTDFSNIEMPWSEEDNGLVLRDLLYDEDGFKLNEDENGVPTADYDDVRWEILLDQCKISEMTNFYNYASYHTEPIESIGLPRTNEGDGPVGWACFMDASTFYDTCSYCAQTLIAATWSKELVEDFGKMIGNEGIVGNEKGDKMPYSGWYAPGVNIHRSPFGGRNFEYYSEDGVLSGKLAAAQISGCNSKGVYTFIKHYAVNEQETHRSVGGDASWLTEQSMREIYLRPFEIAVKAGGTRGLMTSFNRIGTRWTGGDYRLCTDILRDEWGFKGAVICDFNTNPQYMNSRQMAYAGGDLNLATQPVKWCDESSAADVYVLRQCVKNACYAIVNSNAMNGEIIGYNMPYWQIFLIVTDCVIAAGLAVWGFFAVRGALKQGKRNSSEY